MAASLYPHTVYSATRRKKVRLPAWHPLFPRRSQKVSRITQSPDLSLSPPFSPYFPSHSADLPLPASLFPSPLFLPPSFSFFFFLSVSPSSPSRSRPEEQESIEVAGSICFLSAGDAMSRYVHQSFVGGGRGAMLVWACDRAGDYVGVKEGVACVRVVCDDYVCLWKRRCLCGCVCVARGGGV